MNIGSDKIPSVWKNAFVSLQTDFAGVVRSTNKNEVVTISAIIRKQREVETVVTDQTDNASIKIGLCPRIVNLNKPGRTARVPVKIFNMSAKVLTIRPKAGLCKLQEVKVLRSWDPKLENTEEVHTKKTT